MMCEKFEHELFFLLFAYKSGLRTLFGGRGGCAQEWP